MANPFSVNDLLEFLDHLGERGLMPASTARALTIASRTVLGVLSDAEKADLSTLDIDAVIKRFNNKRSKDFNPSSLKEYGRRVKRALDLFHTWREDPASFTVKTRSTTVTRRSENALRKLDEPDTAAAIDDSTTAHKAGFYHSAVPVRPGVIVTVANIPNDLTKAEADRLADFVRMLAVN